MRSVFQEIYSNGKKDLSRVSASDILYFQMF